MEPCEDCGQHVDGCACGATACAACGEYPRYCVCSGRVPPRVEVTATCGHVVRCAGDRTSRRAAGDRDCARCVRAYRAAYPF